MVTVDTRVDHDDGRTGAGVALKVDEVGFHRGRRLVEEEVKWPRNREALDRAARLEFGESLRCGFDGYQTKTVESSDNRDISGKKRGGTCVAQHDRRPHELRRFLVVERRRTRRSGDRTSDGEQEHHQGQQGVPEGHKVLTNRRDLLTIALPGVVDASYAQS